MESFRSATWCDYLFTKFSDTDFVLLINCCNSSLLLSFDRFDTVGCEVKLYICVNDLFVFRFNKGNFDCFDIGARHSMEMVLNINMKYSQRNNQH